MAIINAYFDESGKHKDHPVVTFCGVCVSQLKVEQFDHAWNELLRTYGWPSLHMVKVMKARKFSHNVSAESTAKRVEAMRPFVDCINTKLEYGIIQALDVRGFNALSKDIRAGLGNPDDPYYIAFARGLLGLVDYVHPPDNISVICDDDKETAWDWFRHFQGIQRIHADIRKRVISLTFANDDYFPALQAADMIAYVARLEAKRQFYGTPHSYGPLLDHLVDKQPPGSAMRWGVIFADEKLMRSMKTQADLLNDLDLGV